MFIKNTCAKGHNYIKLVESYRDENGITRHNVLYNFGRLDILKADKSFVTALKKLCQLVEVPISEDRERIINDCSEAVIFNYGYIAYAALWEKLGIRSCFERLQQNSRIQFNLNQAAFLMAVQHLLQPRSKLATYEHQGSYYKMPELELQHLYRTLDKLAESKEWIEKELFDKNHLKIGQKVDVVFYDVTTFAFQSFQVDEIRNFGFSKDCKFNEVQVVMGLLIDNEGMPIGYELFPGNTFDGKTMVASLENLKKKFSINRVVIVADRGLNSKNNLNLIRDAGYGYIVASKIRSMKREIKDQILNNEGYTDVGEGFCYKVMEYENIFKDENKVLHRLEEHLIVSYSEKRALKDKSDRQRLINKANKLLTRPASIEELSKRGGKKYLKSEGQKSLSWKLDAEKIENDSKFDGYYGIQTSEKNMSAEEIIEAYHTLWRIEDSFRVMKSTLEVRPVFHWNPKRIRGHFMMCFLAFMMERKLENLILVEDDKISKSPENIREALNLMQLAMIETGEDKIYIKTRNNALGNTIFKALNLKLPANVNREEQLEVCFRVGKRPLWGQLSLF